MTIENKIQRVLQANTGSEYRRILYGIYFNGTLVSFGNERLFKSRGMAIKAITDASGGHSAREKYNQTVEELIKSGVIEIREF